MNIPTHVGFILDGNRRWAKLHGKLAVEGHKAGYDNFKKIVKQAFDLNIQYVSAYVFSTENWQRSKSEVNGIMTLLNFVLTKEIAQFHKDGVRIIFSGSRSNLDSKLLKSINSAEELTAKNTAGTVIICFNYSGQGEITDAVKKILDSGIESDAVTPEVISQNLYNPDIPPPDLIIRTSGEQRLSGFLLWQSVYSELVFSDKLWPDYTKNDLEEDLRTFTNRQRRYGK